MQLTESAILLHQRTSTSLEACLNTHQKLVNFGASEAEIESIFCIALRKGLPLETLVSQWYEACKWRIEFRLALLAFKEALIQSLPPIFRRA